MNVRLGETNAVQDSESARRDKYERQGGDEERTEKGGGEEKREEERKR